MRTSTRQERPPFDHVARNDARFLGEVLSWVDPRFGPLTSFSHRKLAPPDPDWWLATVTLPTVPVGFPVARPQGIVSGCSIDPDAALNAALGEGLERFSAVQAGQELATDRRCPDPELAGRAPICRADEPGASHIRPLDPLTPITLTPLTSLADDRELWVPAAWVDLNFTPPADEPPVALPMSTGLAFHRDLPRALWAGLCEVAERDASMIAWWSRRSSPSIGVGAANASLPTFLGERLDRLKRARLSCAFYDLTIDFPAPTVACLLRSDEFPFAIYTTACHSEPARACSKALDEAIALRLTARGLPRWPSPGACPERVRTLEDHTAFYATIPHSDVLGTGDPPHIAWDAFLEKYSARAPKALEHLRSVASELGELGLTVLWVDITAPEVRPYGCTVKVAVPEMMPLSPDHATRWLATPRLLRIAGREAGSPCNWNSAPHPFA